MRQEEKKRSALIVTVLAVVTIIVGALETAGGMQELVVQGIFNNRKWPLIGGTLGAVAGVFLLSAGIALFRRSPETTRIVWAAAAVGVPVFFLIGVIDQLAGYPATILGLGLPLILLAALRFIELPYTSSIDEV